jgi:hydrogenase expression/formation protein HypC
MMEPPLLPLAAAPDVADWSTGAACSVDDDGCITCGDVAVELTVVDVGEYDALCRDGDGREELVATELVGEVAVGDRLLVHAKVALEKVLGPKAPARVPRDAKVPDTEVETHAFR